MLKCRKSGVRGVSSSSCSSISAGSAGRGSVWSTGSQALPLPQTFPGPYNRQWFTQLQSANEDDRINENINASIDLLCDVEDDGWHEVFEGDRKGDGKSL